MINAIAMNIGAVAGSIITANRNMSRNHDGSQIRFSNKNLLKNAKLNFLLAAVVQIRPLKTLQLIAISTKNNIAENTRKKKNPLTEPNKPAAACWLIRLSKGIFLF